MEIMCEIVFQGHKFWNVACEKIWSIKQTPQQKWSGTPKLVELYALKQLVDDKCLFVSYMRRRQEKAWIHLQGVCRAKDRLPSIFLVLLYKAKEFNPPLMGNKVTFHFTTFHWKSQHAINLLPRIKRIPGTPRISY